MKTALLSIFLITCLIFPAFSQQVNPMVVTSPEPDVKIDPPREQFEKKIPDPSFITGPVFGARGVENGFFKYPTGMAFDNQGNLWIADWGNKRVQAFNPDKKSIIVIDINLDGPCGIAIDSRNYLYVSEIRNNRISKFDLKGNFIDIIGSYGKGIGKFREPRGIAVDNLDNLYVSDTKNRRIQKFDKKGKFVTKFVYRYKRADFEKPRWVACDSFGNVYTVYPDVNRIVKFDKDGNLLFDFGSSGNLGGQFNQPRAINVDANDNFYVSDYKQDRIQKFTSSGDFVEIIGLKAKPGALNDLGCLSRPEGVCFDKLGRLYVADAEHDRIQIFNLKPEILYRNEAQLNLRAGKRKEAVDSYLKLKALLPEDTEAADFLKKTYLIDAKSHEVNKKYDDATDTYKKMVQLGLYSKKDYEKELKKLKFLKYKWIIYSLSASLILFLIIAVIIINTGRKKE